MTDHKPMLNGWLDWIKIAVVVLPIFGIGAVAHYRIGRSEEAIATNASKVLEQNNRIVTIEAEKRAIQDSLNEIKQSLRDISNDLKTHR